MNAFTKSATTDLLLRLSHSVFGFKMCNGRQFYTSYFPLPVINACDFSQFIPILPNSRHNSRILSIRIWISGSIKPPFSLEGDI